MGSGRDAHDSGHKVGSHTLGPHVVGQRVVVRRLLRGQRGPTGGPAFTDVLGTCMAWGEGTCVVAPETGEEVRITLADIVSGKPVPPRPSPRHRVSAWAAERHARVLWPRVERVALGDWELRCDPAPDGRLLKRTNSCLAIGDPGMPLVQARGVVEQFYADRGRRPLIQVEAGSDVEDALVESGWGQVPESGTAFQLASVSRLARTLARRRSNTPATTAPPPEVESDGERCTIILSDPDDGVLGRIRAGVDRDWVGLHGLTVADHARRQGVGTVLLAEAIEWAGERGATTAWLHVEEGNSPALGFWAAAGFTTHHLLHHLEVP
ncbi:GNAT family N-acetyltransferase [Nocardioides sp. AE5]|uniref:GNAT family N-acetyltransferase n=1 Tax=Nocardioides sp. AE5 TaxID=2962573 RepID=UPI00288189B1|nr:GNAT family N-acetyltransferase [Nocardioides sp. AE5]MDT0202129.1 GNAT family N-acetyltransferase [Nocardioides sp. AE5]